MEIMLLERVFESLLLQEVKDVWLSCHIAIFEIIRIRFIRAQTIHKVALYVLNSS